MLQIIYWPPFAESVDPVMSFGLVRREEHDAARDLLGLAQAAQRDKRQNRLLQHFLGDRLHHFGGDIARADRVDRDFLVRVLLGKRLVKPMSPALAAE